MASEPAEFGIRLAVRGALDSAGAIRRFTSECAHLGYEALWGHDFIVWNRHVYLHHVSCGSVEAVEQAEAPHTCHEPSTSPGRDASPSTTGIGLVFPSLPYRQPLIQSHQLVNLDVLGNGRLILDAPVGAPPDGRPHDLVFLGVPRKEKQIRAKDYLRAMKNVWAPGRTVYDGGYFSIPNSQSYPKPMDPTGPPFRSVVGDKSTAMLAGLGDR